MFEVEVVKLVSDGNNVIALVRGSEIYTVTIASDIVSCTCPHFLYRKEICKHIKRVLAEIYIKFGEGVYRRFESYVNSHVK